MALAEQSPLLFAFDNVLIVLNIVLMLFIVHTLYELLFAHAPLDELASGLNGALYDFVMGTGPPRGMSGSGLIVGGKGRGGGASEIGLLDIEL